MGRLKPLPFREIKRRLEAVGFIETSQKGSHVKFVRRVGPDIDTEIVLGNSQDGRPTAQAHLRYQRNQ